MATQIGPYLAEIEKVADRIESAHERGQRAAAAEDTPYRASFVVGYTGGACKTAAADLRRLVRNARLAAMLDANAASRACSAVTSR